MTSVQRCPVVVGRAGELALVRRLVAAAASGRGGALVVLGEAGVGKTRLLDVAAEAATGAGLLVLGGRAVQGGGSYRAVAEAVVRRLDAPGVRTSAAVRPYLPALDALVTGGVAAPAGVPAADPAVVLGEGVLRVAGVLAPAGCLLRLEDLHWADEDTLAVVDYLAAAVADRPVLVAVSCRDEAAGAAVAARLRALPESTAVHLARLGEADVGALAAACRDGRPLPPDEVRELYARSDGLPFLAEELLAGGDREVPPSLAALVAGRLAVLDPAGRTVLHAAAVLGPDPDWRLLGRVSGVAEEDAVEALRRAADVGLVVRADGALRWPHALARDAVLAALLPPERAALSARAADVLVARAGPDDEPRAAQLYADAGRPRDAAAVLLRLARRAAGRGALHSADALLARAAAAAPGLGAVAEIVGERVSVLTLAGRADEALALGAAHVDELTGDSHAEVCLRLARAAVTAARWGSAEEYVERAGRPGDPRSTVLRADAAFGAGRTDEAAVLAAEAVVAAERSGAPAVLCEALGAVARTRWQTDLAASGAAYRRAAQVAAEHGLTPWRVTALFGTGMIEALDGDELPTLRRARELATDAGMLAQLASIELIESDHALHTSGPGPAEELARRAADAAERLRLPQLRAQALVQVAAYRAAAGDAAGTAAALAASDGEPGANPFRGFATAMEPLLEHDLGRAVAEMDPTVPLVRGDRGIVLLSPVGLWLLLRTAAEDRAAEARGLVDAVPGGLSRAIRASLRYADAVTAGRDGRAEDVAAHLAAADAALARRPWWRRLLRLVVWECAAAEDWGDPVAGLRADLAAHHQAGDAHLERACRDLLRRAGAPTTRRRGGTVVAPQLAALGVTGREAEVLALVARGLTNAEVAQRLVLSRRTVETHVANLLAKTGAASRRELGRWAQGVSSGLTPPARRAPGPTGQGPRPPPA